MDIKTTTIDIQSVITGGDSTIKIFNLGTFIGVVAGILLTVAGIAAFMYLVLGGLKWVLAGGEKGKIEEAKQMITQSIIGLAVTAAAFALFAVIQYVLGINIVSLGGESSGESSYSVDQQNKKSAESEGYNASTGHWDCENDYTGKNDSHGSYVCYDNKDKLSDCRVCWEGKYYSSGNAPKAASFSTSECPSICDGKK